MKIAGSGSIPGGEYQEEIHISGTGKVTGSTSCTGVSISGTGKIEGDLHCTGEVSSSGSGKVKGDLEADELHSSGSFDVEGGLRCKKISSSGSLNAGSVSADKLHISGMLKCDEDISAEDAVIRGYVKSGGLINAEKLDIEFDTSSEANSIGGSSIRIRKKGFIAAAILKFIGKDDAGLFKVSGSIEGDDIDIEYVEADSVTGKNVKIGPGCNIGVVSFSGTYKASEDSVVGTVEEAK